MLAAWYQLSYLHVHTYVIMCVYVAYLNLFQHLHTYMHAYNNPDTQ